MLVEFLDNFARKTFFRCRNKADRKKKWEDNIREWTGLEFAKSQRAVEDRKKMGETGCEVISGTSTIPAVKE